jgi:Rv2632c-like
MHKHITIEIGIDEDDTTTLVHAVLDLRGEHFDATGRAKRSPGDPCIPVIGEELALARALGSLEDQIIDAAYERIDGLKTVAG